jgi:hypothetical protein
MRKPLVLLVGLLLCPVLAGAQTRYNVDQPFWLGVGIGGGRVNSDAPAPSAGHDTFAFTIDAGMRITPQWGIGLEYGRIAPGGGCGGHRCTPADHDFAPDFSHWFLLAEHRSGEDGAMRLRAGLGISGMCYHFYKTGNASFWEVLLAVVIADESDATIRHWECDSLHALGASVSLGYQWALPDSGSSIGLQLRGEAANFKASSSAGTPKFRHRAVTVQIQLNLN